MLCTQDALRKLASKVEGPVRAPGLACHMAKSCSVCCFMTSMRCCNVIVVFVLCSQAALEKIASKLKGPVKAQRLALLMAKS